LEGTTEKFPAISASGIAVAVSGTSTALITKAVFALRAVGSGSAGAGSGFTSTFFADGSTSGPAGCGGEAGTGSAGFSKASCAITGMTGAGVSAFFFCAEAARTGAAAVGTTTMLGKRTANFSFGAFTRSGRRMVCTRLVACGI
jgi:hypothetical protein